MSETKHYKRVFAVIFSITLLVIGVNSVFAGKYSINGYIYKGFKSEDYKSTGEYYKSGIYKYYISYRPTKGIIIDCDHTIIGLSHTKGKNGGKEVSASDGESYTYETTKNYNNSLKMDFGKEGVISLSSEKGYGTSEGWVISASSARGVCLSEKELGKNAPTGNYALAAGVACYRMRANKYNSLLNEHVKNYYYYMPKSKKSNTIYTVYSDDNENTWTIYS